MNFVDFMNFSREKENSRFDTTSEFLSHHNVGDTLFFFITFSCNSKLEKYVFTFM